jgi:hypothetical protein
MGIKNSIIYNILELKTGLKRNLFYGGLEDFKDGFTA